jgi:hypothetical protein
MSLSTILYLAGMAWMFIAQRILDGEDTAQTGLTIVAVAFLVAAATLRFRALRAAREDGIRLGNRVALMFLLVGCASLVLYTATTDSVVTSLTLAEESEERWLGVWRSLWPLVWLLGTLPLIVVDYAVQSSPVMMPNRRVRALAMHGLVAAMGLALVFPINYVASQEKENWDLAYFKTPTPGTATLALAQALESRIDVRIFMPPSSEVAQELQNYFAPLEGPNFTVEVIDQAAQPRLANALSVRDNGVVAFTAGDVDLDEEPVLPMEGEEKPEEDDGKPKPVTRTLKVNVEFEKAQRTLKKIDSEVQKLIIEVGHGERTAYFTTGHGELTWKSAPLPFYQIVTMRDRMKELGFNIKTLGVHQGLAEKVPDDADVVIVLGPKYPFQPLEVQALRSYLEGGGALLIALDPVPMRAKMPEGVTDPLEEMVEEVMGLRYGKGMIADERNHFAMTNNAQDMFLVATDSYSQHASSSTLAAERAPMIVPLVTHLDETETHESAVHAIVKTRATSWDDTNFNAVFESEAGESKNSRTLIAAVTGGSGGVDWRALVSSGSGPFSDAGLGGDENRGLLGNVLMVDDTINWLIGAEAFSGTTESEEDVRIDHTKGTQKWWFYGTVLGLPLVVFLLGAARMRIRRVGRIGSNRPGGASRGGAA